jgi:hypothetical protein
MLACCHGDDYLPIVKMLINHPKIEVNQQNEVITVEKFCVSNFLSLFVFLYFSMVGQHCIKHLITVTV